MAEETGQERSLPATLKRREEARKKGQVARSREFVTSLLLLGVAGLLYESGSGVYGAAQRLLAGGLAIDRSAAMDPQHALSLVAGLWAQGAMMLAPVLLVTVLASVAGGLALGGWLFSTEALMPDFGRLDPLAGLQRMFSVTGLLELIKAILKALVVGVVALLILWTWRGDFLGLIQTDPHVALVKLGTMCARSFLWLAAASLLVVAFDVPYQIFSLNRKLKMSRQEVQDEAKETEGNPQLKARIRALQKERARQRMMAAVPKADVVVTNPTHYAVAIAYAEGRHRAPVVVAKGMDLLAQKIRETAQEHGVPVVEAPPLARALYRHGELEQEIPFALYRAVAELLAYVYQLRIAPDVAPPDEWQVPEEMDIKQ